MPLWSRSVTLAATACAVNLLLAAPAAAESMRCGGYLVQVGDGKAEILQHCGEPVLRDSFCKPLAGARARPFTAADGTVVVAPPCENVDEWTYNPGYGQFMTTLQFVEGQLRAIRYGNRVR